MKKITQTILSIIFIFLLKTSVIGQCTFGGAQYPFGIFSSPPTAFTTVITCTYGGEYQLYNFVNGTQYEWSYCTGDGAANAAGEDMQLTLFNDGTGVFIAYSDDVCGLAPKITWTANFTGTVRMLTNLYYCGTNTTCHTLSWRTVSALPPAPSSITSTASSICTGASVTMTAVGPVGTVYWFSGGCNTTGQIATGNSATVSPTSTTTYYARNFNGGQWSPSCASFTVVVNPLPTVNAGTDVSICPSTSTTLSGTVPAPSTLSSVLAAKNANQAALTSSIPSPYGYVMDGPSGVNSNYIGDGGNDMYDGGNYINTNLGVMLNYSDNAVVSNAAFGAGGQYFTRVIGAQGYSTVAPTIFYWAADLNGVSSVSITGNNGADGSGTQDLNTFTVTANGITYNCFLKRFHSAFDPSINQLFMIPQPNSASQSIGGSTDDNLHTISGLTGVTRMYYMLYAGNGGAIISVA